MLENASLVADIRVISVRNRRHLVEYSLSKSIAATLFSKIHKNGKKYIFRKKLQ